MRDKVRTSLKRWRDNRYVSAVLAEATFPVHKLCSATAHQIESHITKNGVAIKLPNGKKMKLGSGTSTGLSSIFFWHGIDGFEPKTSQSLRFLFERSTTFIDVGANVGCYSVLGALWNPGLEVVAFEPVPQIFDKLVSNVHLNGVKQQVRCENAALSSKSGVATFLLPPSENSDLETTGTLVEDGWQARKIPPVCR